MTLQIKANPIEFLERWVSALPWKVFVSEVEKPHAVTVCPLLFRLQAIAANLRDVLSVSGE
jgi:hypothetical protein